MAHPVVKPPEHPVEKGDSVLGEVKFGCVCTVDYLESCCCRNITSFEWSSPIITVSLLVCPVPKCLRSLCQQYSWGAGWTPGGSIQRHVSYFLYFSQYLINAGKPFVHIYTKSLFPASVDMVSSQTSQGSG